MWCTSRSVSASARDTLGPREPGRADVMHHDDAEARPETAEPVVGRRRAEPEATPTATPSPALALKAEALSRPNAHQAGRDVLGALASQPTAPAAPASRPASRTAGGTASRRRAHARSRPAATSPEGTEGPESTESPARACGPDEVRATGAARASTAPCPHRPHCPHPAREHVSPGPRAEPARCPDSRCVHDRAVPAQARGAAVHGRGAGGGPRRDRGCRLPRLRRTHHVQHRPDRDARRAPARHLGGAGRYAAHPDGGQGRPARDQVGRSATYSSTCPAATRRSRCRARPAQRGWRVLFGRGSMPPFIVDSSIVDPHALHGGAPALPAGVTAPVSIQ